MSSTAAATRRQIGWPWIGLLSAVSALAVGPAPALLPLLYLAAVTPALLLIDLREHRLPNRLVLPAIIVGVIGLGGEWIRSGALPLVPLLAGLGYFAFLLVLGITGGMGMGDVKLGAALGLASPTFAVAVLSPVLAFALGGVASVVLLATRGRGARVAFGPYLLAGYWGAIAVHTMARFA